MDYTFIGQQIRNRRKQLGLIQDQLAEAADLSTIALSNIERGKKQLHLDTLIRIADALGTPVDALLGREAQSCETQNSKDLLDLWSGSTHLEQHMILAVTKALIESHRRTL